MITIFHDEESHAPTVNQQRIDYNEERFTKLENQVVDTNRLVQQLIDAQSLKYVAK